MKIIDEKGRLFGKINIIDFFAIVFLISFLPMFYFGYKIINKKSKEKVQNVGTKDTKTLLNTEERLNALEKKVDSLLIPHEERLNTLEKKVDSLLIPYEERLNTLEKKVDSLLFQKLKK